MVGNGRRRTRAPLGRWAAVSSLALWAAVLSALATSVVAIVIGKVGFSIAEGRSETLLVHLSTTGRQLLGKAGLGGLRVTVKGGGIQAGTIVLKTARKAPRHTTNTKHAVHRAPVLELIARV
jgi:hypothetical protein